MEATLVGLLACMQLEVLLQAAQLLEVLAAIRIGVGTTPHVQVHVVAQGAGAGQVTSTYSTLASLGTNWANPSGQVNLPVNAERGPACKGLATLLRRERALASVKDLVLLQVSFGAVSLVTLSAWERPHNLVGQQVDLEALLRTIALATLHAHEGLVARMDKAVFLLPPELQEGFTTLPTAVPMLDHLLLGQNICRGIWAATTPFHQLCILLPPLRSLQWVLFPVLWGC